MGRFSVILIVFMLFSACTKSVDVLVVGGGTSGVAAGLQASRSGACTMIVEEGPWLGGMLTSAGVSAVDGNYNLRGGIFAEFADSLASYYGGYDSLFTGWVSRIMFEPHVGNEILVGMTADEPLLNVEFGKYFEKAEKTASGWKVTFSDIDGSGKMTVRTKVLIDATELGDVAATCGVRYKIGMDARSTTGESIAPESANDIVQDMTYVAILKDYGKGADKTIERPDGYDPSMFANCCKNKNNTVPRPGQALWSPQEMLDYGKLPGGKYMLNWPIEGNDYYTNVIEMSPEERLSEYKKAKDFTLGFIYFIQTELGYRNLGIADDEFPTDDGLPIIPYHRESRRIEGEAFLTVDHAARPFSQEDPLFRTGIAVGDYAVDHHHHRHPRWNELPELHFYPIPSYNVPLGSLIPKNVDDLVVAEKSVSVSNLMNGTTRLQPVVMQIGQAAGALAALSVAQGKTVRDVAVRDVQDVLLDAGAYIMPYLDLKPGDRRFKAIQRIGASGIIHGEGRNEGWSNQTWIGTGTPSESYRRQMEGMSGDELIDFLVRIDSLEDPFHSVPVDLIGHSISEKSSSVNPLIGSGGHGHVFVGASVPHGMVAAGPNNVSDGWDWCSGYHDSDRTIAGFAQNHLSGTGIADLGEIVLMPFTGETLLDKSAEEGRGYAVRYDKAGETVSPGYYSVEIGNTGIKAELTATEKVAFHSYSFPGILSGNDGSGASKILIDLKSAPKSIPVRKGCLDSYAELKDSCTVVGWRLSDEWAHSHKVWFAARFSVPVAKACFYNQGRMQGLKKAKGDDVRVVLNFGHVKNVEVKVALSYTSEEGAYDNLSEVSSLTFAQARDLAVGRWEQTLSTIDFKGITSKVDTVFNTALYHTAISPQLYSDKGSTYSVFSLWDTYRAVHPLYTLIDPSAPDYVNSIIAISEKEGSLPVWHLAGKETNCMVGIHSVHVIADAVLKDMKGVDSRRAYSQIKKFASQQAEGLEYIDRLGWLPADKVNWSVSRALEYCIDDDAVARVAQKLGDAGTAEYYSSRAKSYRNYFHDGYMRGRLENGSWRTPFDPSFSLHEEADYVEGNAWQYTWLVPHDVEGLIGLFGGKDAFLMQLDALFAADSTLNEGASADITGMIGQFAHGNEPSHHIPYLYAMAGMPERTAELIRQICNDFYTTSPNGLIGNEDCGQMSAWYIFSALGFYPVNPLDGRYIFGSPLAKDATLHLANGREFRIVAHGNSPENRYIESVSLNGKPYKENYITYEDIRRGGVLEFVMTDKKTK